MVMGNDAAAGLTALLDGRSTRVVARFLRHPYIGEASSFAGGRYDFHRSVGEDSG